MPTIAQLAVIDKFFCLKTIDTSLPDAEARIALLNNLTHYSPSADVAMADQEATRLLALSRFKTEKLLEYAYSTLELKEHPLLAEFDARADAMTRLIWLRIHASDVFNQIETIFLTYHFHGHEKFYGFAVSGGTHRPFHWTDEIEHKLHEAVSTVLLLSPEEKLNCEIIHFEMETEEAGSVQLLNYLVVYHPGKMRTLRQIKESHRDLLTYVPALEATLVYDRAQNKVHVLSSRQKIAEDLAKKFSEIGFEQVLSREPVDAVTYDLSMFRADMNIKTKGQVPGIVIEEAWVAAMEMSLGHTRHSVSIELANSDNLWQLARTHFGDRNPVLLGRSLKEVKLSFVVRFDGEETTRALDITVGHRGTSNLLTIRDPKLRSCGEAILTALGVMNRIKPAPIGEDLAIFLAELQLLDLNSKEVDGHLLRSLQLDAQLLVKKGLLTLKDYASHIVLQVNDEDGAPVQRRLPVKSDSSHTWAYDEVDNEKYPIDEMGLRKYGIDKAYLRERLSELLSDALVDQPLSTDAREPYFLGNYIMGDVRLPVYLASGLHDESVAEKTDLEIRKQNLGLGVTLTTTAKPTRRFLGPSLTVAIHALLDQTVPGVHLELSRIENEVRRWRGVHAAADKPALIQNSSSSAVLIGPWPDPWTLTKAETVATVAVLVDAWNSGKRKCSNAEATADIGGTRTVRERFKDDPCWTTYIRPVGAGERPRFWELNIGLNALAEADAN